MSRETEGDSTEAVPNFLDKLDESQRNEAVGRLLKLENEDTWNELLGPYSIITFIIRKILLEY